MPNFRFSNFSSHYRASTGTVQLMEDLGRAAQATGPVYAMGGGNPAHIPEAQRLFQRALQAIITDDAQFAAMVGEYDAPKGNVAFCDKLAQTLRGRFGWDIGADNIAVTNGSQSSFGLLFNAFAGRFPDGDFRRILLPLTPEYVGYADVGLADAPIFDGHKPDIALIDERFFKYRVDFNDLQIDDRYGAVCVSRPTNPTGNVITDDELQQLALACEQAGLPFIIDGAYGLPFPNMVFTQASPVWNDNIILCLSLSKLGLPGLRTGIVVATPEVIRLIRNANAINHLAPGRVGPTLAHRLLEDNSLMYLCDQVVKPFYEQKRQHALAVIDHCMADIPVRIHQPEGALFLWLWFEDLQVTSHQLYEALVAVGVFVIPGEHFFPGVSDTSWRHRYECIRINYAGPDATIEQGIALVAQVVRRYLP